VTTISGVLAEMPFSAASICRVDGRTVWVVGHLAAGRVDFTAGFDAQTGRRDPGSLNAPGLALDGSHVLDLEHARGFSTPAKLSVRERASGKALAGVELPGTQRVLRPQILVHGRNALVPTDQGHLLTVDVDEARLIRSIALPAPETLAKRARLLVRAASTLWLVRVLPARGVTEIAPIDPTSGAVGAALEFEGNARAVAGAEAGLMVLSDRRGAAFVEIVALSPGQPRFTLPLASEGPIAAGGHWFAVLEPACVNIVEAREGGFAWHRAPAARRPGPRRRRGGGGCRSRSRSAAARWLRSRGRSRTLA
jgi:hypothetical protein